MRKDQQLDLGVYRIKTYVTFSSDDVAFSSASVKIPISYTTAFITYLRSAKEPSKEYYISLSFFTLNYLGKKHNSTHRSLCVPLTVVFSLDSIDSLDSADDDEEDDGDPFSAFNSSDNGIA